MQGAIWILIATVVVGVVLYLHDRHDRKPLNRDSNRETAPADAETKPAGSGENALAEENDGICCGLHLVCEKDSLSPTDVRIEYYDDEELDRFIGRDGKDYTEVETEEFRNVLMTLRLEDVAGWARSITARRLVLPPEVRDELLIIINELRG